MSRDLERLLILTMLCGVALIALPRHVERAAKSMYMAVYAYRADDPVGSVSQAFRYAPRD